jgi:chondroitin 4-sulfotransferase 11
MIDRQRRIVFVHIPKTGGTSVEDALFPPVEQRTAEDHLWGEPNPHQTGGLQHLTAAQIRDSVGAELFNDCYKFAFVRDPWDRMISLYAYHHERPGLLKMLGLELPRRRSFFRRSKTDLIPFEEYVEAVQTGPRHVQWAPQAEFLFDENGTQLVDFVGRFERLQADFEAACRQAGLVPSPLPHKKKSHKRRGVTSGELYTARSRRMVRELFAADFDRFGYLSSD